MHWIEKPDFKVAGITVNLENAIESAIEQNHHKIEEAICKAINNVVPIKEQVEKIWVLLNQPNRVARNPVPIWLKSDPKMFSAVFDEEVKDTIRVLIHTQTDIMISPLQGEDNPGKKLPLNARQQFDSSKLDLKVRLVMPFEYMNKLMTDQLKSVDLSYQGVDVELGQIQTSHKNSQVYIQFELSGDVEADVEASALPMLDNNYVLRLNDLSFEISSDNPLLFVSDQLLHETLNEFILENTSVSLSKLLNSLDNKIMDAMGQSKLGDKMDLDLKFEKIESDTLLYYNDRFEWWFDVTGDCHAWLNANVVSR